MRATPATERENRVFFKLKVCEKRKRGAGSGRGGERGVSEGAVGTLRVERAG